MQKREITLITGPQEIYFFELVMEKISGILTERIQRESKWEE